MFSVPPVSSDPPHQSSVLPGVLLIAGVGLITELFHRYSVYQEHIHFREDLRRDPGFHVLREIGATPAELSEIAGIEIEKERPGRFRKKIVRGEIVQFPYVSSAITNTTNRLAREIMESANASRKFGIKSQKRRRPVGQTFPPSRGK